MFKKKLKDAESIVILCGDQARDIAFSQSATILETILKSKFKISHSCGGMGTCGTCRIEVVENHATLEGRNDVEIEMASERSFRSNERLACQTKAVDGLKIRVPEGES